MVPSLRLKCYVLFFTTRFATMTPFWTRAWWSFLAAAPVTLAWAWFFADTFLMFACWTHHCLTFLDRGLRGLTLIPLSLVNAASAFFALLHEHIISLA